MANMRGQDSPSPLHQRMLPMWSSRYQCSEQSMDAEVKTIHDNAFHKQLKDPNPHRGRCVHGRGGADPGGGDAAQGHPLRGRFCSTCDADSRKLAPRAAAAAVADLAQKVDEVAQLEAAVRRAPP